MQSKHITDEADAGSGVPTLLQNSLGPTSPAHRAQQATWLQEH